MNTKYQRMPVYIQRLECFTNLLEECVVPIRALPQQVEVHVIIYCSALGVLMYLTSNTCIALEIGEGLLLVAVKSCKGRLSCGTNSGGAQCTHL